MWTITILYLYIQVLAWLVSRAPELLPLPPLPLLIYLNILLQRSGAATQIGKNQLTKCHHPQWHINFIWLFIPDISHIYIYLPIYFTLLPTAAAVGIAIRFKCISEYWKVATQNLNKTNNHKKVFAIAQSYMANRIKIKVWTPLLMTPRLLNRK